MMKYVIAIDQGTTSTRSIAFDETMKIVGVAQQEFKQHFPNSGWVEHDPNDILNTTLQTLKTVVQDNNISPTDIVSIGITNQRETTILWDKRTGKPIYNAIVWQDRRTAPMCDDLKQNGHGDSIRHKTGLLIDAYFSATKIKWILDKTETMTHAEQGHILFGTVDTFLIWHLTGGKSHTTDATNASRTMLYNIRAGAWDDDLCGLLNIPQCMLPEVKNCADYFGVLDSDILGAPIPINGVAGDQQAATIGQACFTPGMLKSTYGTGCFALLNTGDDIVTSKNQLLTTIAYQFDGKPTYALEGSIFIAGSVVQWLRDGLKIIEHASDTQPLAEQADPNQDIYLVPAFTGLGAPYWNAECRGALFGLTRNTGPAEISKSALQSVGYQTRDLLTAMQSDWGDKTGTKGTLRVDGGMTASDWTMQFLADIINENVDRPTILETTALGVAWLAGQHVGLYPQQHEFAKQWRLDKTFTPTMPDGTREKLYTGWQDAVNRIL